MKRFLAAAGLAFAFVPAAAAAREPEGVVQHLAPPAALDPAKAYLLFDSSRAKSGLFKISHVLMRVPRQDEMDAFLAAKRIAYDKDLPKLTRAAKGGPVTSFDDYFFAWKGGQNTFAVDMDETLGASDTFLIEVPPGTYVLYGIAVVRQVLATCNCLGTVQFEAAPGRITHMGSLFADKVHEESPVPHLEDNLGPQMAQYGFVLGQALVPATAETPVPPGLAGFPRALAVYSPVGPFREPGAASINRLAPIPGVLEYDRGRVVTGGR